MRGIHIERKKINYGGIAMLLEEVRYKDEKKHNKLLFNLLIKEETLIISAKCRGNKYPISINLETIIKPYLEPEEVEEVRKVIKSIYKKKQTS